MKNTTQNRLSITLLLTLASLPAAQAFAQSATFDATEPAEPMVPYRPYLAARVVQPTQTYQPAVAAYSSTQAANQEIGYTLLSNNTRSTNSERAWARAFADRQINNGRTRFEYKQKALGLQLGYDLLHTSTSHAGMTVQYTSSNVDTNDRLSTDVGSIDTTAAGLGAYYGLSLSKGGSIDFTAQINHINNRFTSSDANKAKQNAWQAGLSAQIHQPVATIAGWQLSPQLQLVYLYSNNNSFNDNLSNIDTVNTNSLRTRAGLHIQKNSNNTQHYVLANVKYDVIKSQSVTLHNHTGSSSVTVSDTYDQAGFEVVAGLAKKVADNTTLSADAHYERSFAGRQSGMGLDLGLKTAF